MTIREQITLHLGRRGMDMLVLLLHTNEIPAPTPAQARLGDELLRRAAALVDGGAWARMRRIQAEIATGGTRGDPVGDLVREAQTFARGPRDPRHLLRILGPTTGGRAVVTPVVAPA